MESVGEGPSIPDGEEVIADLSNVIYLVKQEDIKPDVSGLSLQGVDPDFLAKGLEKQELNSHNTLYNAVKNEISDDNLTIKHEDIDYEIRSEPKSEINQTYEGKVNEEGLLRIELSGTLCNKNSRYSYRQEEKFTDEKFDESFKCSLCDKTYYSKLLLNRHEKIHTGEKPYKCKYCDKAFSASHSLKEHHRIHTGEKPFKCKYCDNAFSSFPNLNVHQRIHTGEKPFKCKYCDKAFSSLPNLNVHQRIHTGEKPFKCKYCDKAFTTSQNLNVQFRVERFGG